MICLRPLDPLLKDRELGLVYEPKDWLLRKKIANQFMVSAPGHWFWHILMDHVVKHYDPKRSVFLNTGPRMIGDMVGAKNIDIEHPEFFIWTCLILPLTYHGNISSDCPKNSMDIAYCYTRWKEGTGWPKKQKLAEEKSIANGYVPICLSHPLISIIVYTIYHIAQKDLCSFLFQKRKD
jgi:hypothetical protein